MMGYMPLYDKNVKKGSAYGAKYSVGGLLGKRAASAVRRAREGEAGKWWRVSL